MKLDRLADLVEEMAGDHYWLPINLTMSYNDYKSDLELIGTTRGYDLGRY